MLPLELWMRAFKPIALTPRDVYLRTMIGAIEGAQRANHLPAGRQSGEGQGSKLAARTSGTVPRDPRHLRAGRGAY